MNDKALAATILAKIDGINSLHEDDITEAPGAYYARVLQVLRDIEQECLYAGLSDSPECDCVSCGDDWTDGDWEYWAETTEEDEDAMMESFGPIVEEGPLEDAELLQLSRELREKWYELKVKARAAIRRLKSKITSKLQGIR